LVQLSSVSTQPSLNSAKSQRAATTIARAAEAAIGEPL